VTITIRELGLTDGPALLELMDAVEPGWSDRHPPLDGGQSAFLADGTTFVVGAYAGDVPVGWAWGARIRRPDGLQMTYVHQLDVVEPHRRRGIATMLMERSMAIARRDGSRRLWLSTGAHNDVARALYERLGGDRKPLGDVNYWWALD
jgi:ribosomal protein S18 acetylase RimI-like enzyme